MTKKKQRHKGNAVSPPGVEVNQTQPIVAQIILAAVAVECVFDDQTLEKMQQDLGQRFRPVISDFMHDYQLQFVKIQDTSMSVLVPNDSPLTSQFIN